MPAHRLAVAVALAGVLAACGGGDGDTSQPADTAASTAVAPTRPATTRPATTRPATTVPGTTTTPTTPATTAPPEPSSDDWCGLAVVIAERDAQRDGVDFTDPTAVEEYLAPIPELSEQSMLLAPPEIAAAVATSATISLAIYDALQRNGFDMLTLDLSDTEIDLDAGTAAAATIDAYNESECGIPIADDDNDDGDGSNDAGNDGSSGGVDLGGGSLRDLFVAQLLDAGFSETEASCLFDVLDFGDADALTDEAVESAFEGCAIDPARIDELSSVVGG